MMMVDRDGGGFEGAGRQEPEWCLGSVCAWECVGCFEASVRVLV